ncbi:tetratricopeptide repeat protein [bacterium]|nr:tetratricopeptide repeat protein [bacterium]
MLKCEDCNIILDEGTHFCPKCGKDLTSTDGTSRMPKLEVGAYLTSANLHRIRKEWDEAVADATEALRIDQNNADIASLLGVIYQERGMLDDAVIWFQMALEMNPNSAYDRARLKQVKDLIAQGGKASGSQDRLRTFENRTRIWAIGMAAVFIIVLILALIITGRHKTDNYGSQSSIDPNAQTAAQDIDQTNPPIRTPAKAMTTKSARSSSGSLSGSSAGSTRTPAEVKINHDVSAADSIGSAKVDDVIADPRQSIVIVTYTIPAASANKGSIMITSAAIARAAFAANAEVKTVTARCVISPGGQSSTQIAFMGDITRRALEALGANSTSDQIEASFTGIWWNPQIK